VNRQLKLTVLGSNSATPAYGRFPTSQYLNINDHAFLIDCGEAAQVRIAEYKLKRNKISHIFISHMHGDHIFGLPGLITSMNLNSRKEPLTIIGPKGIQEFIDTVMRLSYSYMSFDLNITEIEVTQKEVVLDLRDVLVYAFPVYHRVPTHGFLFEQKIGERKIRKDVIPKYDLSVAQIKSIKSGENLVVDGVKISNKELTVEAVDPMSYAYCADSVADDRIVDCIKGATAMYFETTYTDDLRGQAKERGHATSGQAAEMALKAKVKILVTGHYSSRYKNVDQILEEANSIFPETVLGYDGVMLDIQNYKKS